MKSMQRSQPINTASSTSALVPTAYDPVTGDRLRRTVCRGGGVPIDITETTINQSTMPETVTDRVFIKGLTTGSTGIYTVYVYNGGTYSGYGNYQGGLSFTIPCAVPAGSYAVYHEIDSLGALPNTFGAATYGDDVAAVNATITVVNCTPGC